MTAVRRGARRSPGRPRTRCSAQPGSSRALTRPSSGRTRFFQISSMIRASPPSIRRGRSTRNGSSILPKSGAPPSTAGSTLRKPDATNSLCAGSLQRNSTSASITFRFPSRTFLSTTTSVCSLRIVPLRIDDVGLQPAARAVRDRLLLVGDQRVAEAVLELGAGRPRRRRLRGDVLPDAEQELEARFGAALARGPRRTRRGSPSCAARRERIGVHDLDPGPREVREVLDLLRVARAHEDDERRAVDDALVRQRPPALRPARRRRRRAGRASGSSESSASSAGTPMMTWFVTVPEPANERDELDASRPSPRCHCRLNAGKTDFSKVSARMLKP